MGMKPDENQSTLLKLEGREVVIGISERDDVRKLFLPQGEVRPDEIPVAPANYIASQKGINGMDDFDFFNLMQAIPGHVQGSTVSCRTLEAAEFRLSPGVLNHERARSKIRPLGQLMAP